MAICVFYNFVLSGPADYSFCDIANIYSLYLNDLHFLSSVYSTNFGLFKGTGIQANNDKQNYA